MALAFNKPAPKIKASKFMVNFTWVFAKIVSIITFKPPFITKDTALATIRTPVYNNSKIKIESMHESPMVMILPLLILAIGAIGAGFLFKDLFIGQESSSEFWRNSILFLRLNYCIQSKEKLVAVNFEKIWILPWLCCH